ncbi:MAG: helix-turn-helix transcriptional regulator [Hyphomicrobiaceae bacterium]|nr:helix-turn-helix transcriptional regulator [Hyphomicrobiaceae bacterium]
MARTLRQTLDKLSPERRARIEAEADRLHGEYVTLKELRKARDLTQVRLAETLGVQQATVAKYERQSDLLISTLSSYVEAMGGKLDLVVQFPGQAPMTLEGLGDSRDPGRRRVGE